MSDRGGVVQILRLPPEAGAIDALIPRHASPEVVWPAGHEGTVQTQFKGEFINQIPPKRLKENSDSLHWAESRATVFRFP